MVKIAGGVPVIVDCGKSFKITAELLAQNITPKTKWLILNSPNNPTGACYDEAELRAIAQVLQDNAKVHVLSDEIYEHIVFDEYKHISIGNFLPKDQVFVVNGVSKSHAMTGWRIGYGAGKAEIIKAMVAVQSQSTSNPCSISQAAAVEALNGCQDNIERQTEVYRQKRDLAYNLLKQSDSLHLNKPPGAFYLFIDARDFIAKNNMSGSGEFCKFLLDKAKVATVPGAAFGMEGYFRISFASSFDEIRQGCEQILAACK